MANPFLSSATGNGAQTDFVMGFVMDSNLTYIDVTCTLNGTKITNFAKIDTQTIRFAAPIPSGALVFERFTPGGRKFIFTPGTRVIAAQVGQEFDRQSADSLEAGQFSWRNYYTAKANAGAYVAIDSLGEHEVLTTVAPTALFTTWGSPGAIGNVAPNTGTFTNLSVSGTTTLQSTTLANGFYASSTSVACQFNGPVIFSGSQAQKDSTMENLGVPPYPAKNYFINGQITLAQRFATAAGAVTGRAVVAGASALNTPVYYIDRFYTYFTGTQPTWTVSRQEHALGTLLGLDVPRYYMQHAITATTATTMVFGQRVEDLRRTSGKTMTLSFWARTTGSARTLASSVDQFFGTGGAPSGAVNVTTQNFSLTTTWTRFTKTFTVPSISGKTLGTTANTSRLDVSFSYPISVDTYQFWGFDLREGSTAPSRIEDFGLDGDIRAKRYFRGVSMEIESYSPVINGVDRATIPLDPPMRAAPVAQKTANDAAWGEFVSNGTNANIGSRTPGAYGAFFIATLGVEGEALSCGISVTAAAVGYFNLAGYIQGLDSEMY